MMFRNRKSYITFSTKCVFLEALNWILLENRAYKCYRGYIFCLNSELQTFIPDLLRDLKELGFVD